MLMVMMTMSRPLAPVPDIFMQLPVPIIINILLLPSCIPPSIPPIPKTNTDTTMITVSTGHAREQFTTSNIVWFLLQKLFNYDNEDNNDDTMRVLIMSSYFPSQIITYLQKISMLITTITFVKITKTLLELLITSQVIKLLTKAINMNMRPLTLSKLGWAICACIGIIKKCI